MQLSNIVAALLRAVRFGAYDTDTYLGRVLMQIAARAPEAEHAEIVGVVIQQSGAAILTDDGPRVRFDRGDACAALVDGVPAWIPASEMIAYRIAVADLIRDAKRNASDGRDWNAWVEWRDPRFGEMVDGWAEEWSAEHGGDPPMVRNGIELQLDRDAAARFRTHVQECGTPHIVVMRRAARVDVEDVPVVRRPMRRGGR